MHILCFYTIFIFFQFKKTKSKSGQTKPADVSAEADTQEPGTPTSTEPSSASDNQSTPESQDLPLEKSDAEQDVSAMEVE